MVKGRRQEILNPKHEIPNNIEIQKSKVRNQNAKFLATGPDKSGNYKIWGKQASLHQEAPT